MSISINIAVNKNRIVITQDDGFRKWVKRNKAGIFIIPSYLSNKQIDLLLTNFISGKDPEEFNGKIVKL